REAERNERPVDRETPPRGQYDPLGADRTFAMLLAKEYIGGVFAAQCGSSLGMLPHPIADSNHCHLRAGHDTARYEQPPDRDVRQPVLSVIADAKSAAVF